MSAVLQASTYARRLVEGEARRSGSTVTDAIPIVARRMRTPTNAIWALLFRLPKKVDADLRDSLEAGVVKMMQHEIRTLENEMAAITSGARRFDPVEVAEISEDIARLRARIRP